jgi:hypothetical protein
VPSAEALAQQAANGSGRPTAERDDAVGGEGTRELILGGLVNVRRSAWTFGGAPRGVSDERVIAAWAEIGLRILEGAGGEGELSNPTAR